MPTRTLLASAATAVGLAAAITAAAVLGPHLSTGSAPQTGLTAVLQRFSEIPTVTSPQLAPGRHIARLRRLDLPPCLPNLLRMTHRDLMLAEQDDRPKVTLHRRSNEANSVAAFKPFLGG